MGGRQGRSKAPLDLPSGGHILDHRIGRYRELADACGHPCHALRPPLRLLGQVLGWQGAATPCTASPCTASPCTASPCTASSPCTAVIGQGRCGGGPQLAAEPVQLLQQLATPLLLLGWRLLPCSVSCGCVTVGRLAGGLNGMALVLIRVPRTAATPSRVDRVRRSCGAALLAEWPLPGLLVERILPLCLQAQLHLEAGDLGILGLDVTRDDAGSLADELRGEVGSSTISRLEYMKSHQWAAAQSAAWG